MNNITVVVISRNDEDVLPDAIASCRGFGEVIVIDGSNSHDTEKICTSYKVKSVRHAFKDFSDQRNFGMYHATAEWVLFLDSDERLTDAFKKEALLKIKQYDPTSEIAGYFIHRKTFYYGKDWNFRDRVQRLFYRKKFIEWSGVVHETPKVKGTMDQIESPIQHFTHRNLSQMVRKTNEWSLFEAKLRLESKHPQLAPWRFLRVMGTEFINSYVKNKGYKNGVYGLIEGMYQAFSIFITYAKLWELQQRKV